MSWCAEKESRFSPRHFSLHHPSTHKIRAVFYHHVVVIPLVEHVHITHFCVLTPYFDPTFFGTGSMKLVTQHSHIFIHFLAWPLSLMLIHIAHITKAKKETFHINNHVTHCQPEWQPPPIHQMVLYRPFSHGLTSTPMQYLCNLNSQVTFQCCSATGMGIWGG